jgi:Mrp family chromosome partitioning ATPase
MWAGAAPWQILRNMHSTPTQPNNRFSKQVQQNKTKTQNTKKQQKHVLCVVVGCGGVHVLKTQLQ